MTQSEKSKQPVIDAAAVKHIAALAMLMPDDDEQARLEKELGEIIEYFRRLEKLDTDEATPAYHPQQLENQLRGDQTRPSEDRDELLALAARQKDGCLAAPRTVE